MFSKQSYSACSNCSKSINNALETLLLQIVKHLNKCFGPLKITFNKKDKHFQVHPLCHVIIKQTSKVGIMVKCLKPKRCRKRKNENRTTFLLHGWQEIYIGETLFRQVIQDV